MVEYSVSVCYRYEADFCHGIQYVMPFGLICLENRHLKMFVRDNYSGIFKNELGIWNSEITLKRVWKNFVIILLFNNLSTERERRLQKLLKN